MLSGITFCPLRECETELLVMELWNVGDLAIATPFLQAAAKSYAVTRLAKPVAKDLKARFWPELIDPRESVIRIFIVPGNNET